MVIQVIILGQCKNKTSNCGSILKFFKSEHYYQKILYHPLKIICTSKA